MRASPPRRAPVDEARAAAGPGRAVDDIERDDDVGARAIFREPHWVFGEGDGFALQRYGATESVAGRNVLELSRFGAFCVEPCIFLLDSR